MKVLSERNKASRAKQQMIPRTGKKSFTEIAENMKEELGHSPTHRELFANCYVHKRKDGTEPTSEAVKEALDKMYKLVKEAPEDYDDRVGRNDIFSQVVGKERNGYMRMYGVGVSPSGVFGPTPSSSISYMNVMDMKTKMDNMEKRVVEMDKELQKLRSNRRQTLTTPSVTHTSSDQLFRVVIDDEFAD